MTLVTRTVASHTKKLGYVQMEKIHEYLHWTSEP